MNWGEIKLATLKKMDPTIRTLAENRNTRDYLNGMAETANRGLQDLATAGKFIVKDFKITQMPIENKLTDTMKIFQCREETIPFQTDRAKSYYFEIDGKGAAELYVGENLLKRVENASMGFTAYKGLIPNESGDSVKIQFKGAYPFQFRNVALYDADFASDEDVWEYVREKRYDLKARIPDFYKLITTDVVYQSDGARYKKEENYYWEGDSVLVLDGFRYGEWIVHYFSYPQLITKDTPDEEEMELDPEVAVLLPLYMASQLYEDDDLGISSYWAQQYNEGKSRLLPSLNLGRASDFVDVYGWS